MEIFISLSSIIQKSITTVYFIVKRPLSVASFGQNCSFISTLFALLYIPIYCISLIKSTEWKFSFQSTEPFLNVHWMLTECSLISGFQALFNDLSVSIQSQLNAAEWQVHFREHSVFLFIFQFKTFSLDRGCQAILS